MTERTWTCNRVEQSVQCGHVNARRYQKCQACGKKRPPSIGRKSAHFEALEISYEAYIKLNGGEFCGICKRGPSADRRLDRDHEHYKQSPGYGQPRGLLCPNCNRKLWPGIDSKWAAALLEYLLKAEARY